MRIALINPSFNRYGGLKGHGGSLPPINLCSLAAYGREKHPDVEFKIIDGDIHGLSHEDTIKQVEAFSPDLTGITSNTCVFDSVIELTAGLKTAMPKIPVITGGPHPSAMPKETLAESETDFIAMSEGELTFNELIQQMKDGDEDWGKIKGLGYRDETGKPKVNMTQPLIMDLDALPLPARDLLDNSLYQPAPTKRVHGGPVTPIISSRGCPFNCGFCGAQSVWTRRYRHRSPENIVAEIEHCIETYGIRAYRMTDELFTAKKQRVLDICRLMVDRKLDISWVCNARAQKLDLETLEAMRDAGCKEISFGIESGNQKILEKIDKSMDLNEAERVIRLVKKTGMKTHASYMFGYLGEDEGTMRDTIRFAKKLNTDMAAFFIASPLPGTPFYDEAKDKGLMKKDISWINFSPLSNQDSVVEYPTLSSETIRKWHRKAIRTYYLRPRYILQRLLKLRHWYEIENLFMGLRLFLNIRS